MKKRKKFIQFSFGGCSTFKVGRMLNSQVFHSSFGTKRKKEKKKSYSHEALEKLVKTNAAERRGKIGKVYFEFPCSKL